MLTFLSIMADIVCVGRKVNTEGSMDGLKWGANHLSLETNMISFKILYLLYENRFLLKLVVLFQV